MLHQYFLTGPVTVIHGPYLGDGGVGFVQEGQVIVGKEVQQGMGPLPRFTAVQDAGIVLDAGAGAYLQQHFDVVIGALLQPLGFQQTPFAAEPLQPLQQLRPNLLHGPLNGLLVSDEVPGGIDENMLQSFVYHLAGDRIESGDPLHRVAEKFQADAMGLIGREDFQQVAPHPEVPRLQHQVVAYVMAVHQPVQQLAAIMLLPHTQFDPALFIGRGGADAKYATDGGHYDHIPPLQQGGGGLQPQPVDILVDGRVLLDEGVRDRQVGLRLVIIVITDEKLNGVIGKQ